MVNADAPSPISVAISNFGIIGITPLSPVTLTLALDCITVSAVAASAAAEAEGSNEPEKSIAKLPKSNPTMISDGGGGGGGTDAVGGVVGCVPLRGVIEALDGKRKSFDMVGSCPGTVGKIEDDIRIEAEKEDVEGKTTVLRSVICCCNEVSVDVTISGIIATGEVGVGAETLGTTDAVAGATGAIRTGCVVVGGATADGGTTGNTICGGGGDGGDGGGIRACEIGCAG